jgi:hypothetical protein
VRIGGRLIGAAAGVAMVVVGCTNVTGGDPGVNAGDASSFRTSMSMSSVESVASSRARESQRQAAQTSEAVQATCDTLAMTSADSIEAVNDYVSARNGEGGDPAETQGPAVDALQISGEAVGASMSEILPTELADAVLAWVEGAYAAAEAISAGAGAAEFNDVIDGLNDARTEALQLCDAMYR